MSRIRVRYRKPLRGKLAPPPDKSISHRAVILSSIAEGKSIIRNFLLAEDPMRTLNAFRQMGIDMEIRDRGSGNRETRDNEILINGKGLRGLKDPGNIIDCGNSGTTMRLLSGILAGQLFSATLTGDSSLRSRPMQRIITPLTEMDAVITSEQGGYPPLRIKGGKLRPVKYKSPVASAQVKSAILLAGLYCDGITSFNEPEKSRDHTERMLAAGGVEIEIKSLEVCVKGTSALNPFDLTVPGDFSSASFFIAGGLLIPRSEILIKDTGINPTRTGLIDILIMMGADIKLENKREVSGEPVADIYVKHSQLSGINITGDMVLKAIDEFPILCVAAAKAQGKTKITGAGELRVKESDRITSMAVELRKMGVNVEELEDGLIIEGTKKLKPADVQSYGDHRIAMALIIAGFTVDKETTVQDTECINTSFPDFIGMLEGLMR